MRVTPTGQSIYYDGNEVARYGRDISAGATYVVHYHDGIGGEPLWGMDTEVERKISVSVDTILVADANNGLYAVDRDAWTSQKRELDRRPQYVISDEHEAVEHLGDPTDHLQGHLWIESGNEVDEGYHKRKNEA